MISPPRLTALILIAVIGIAFVARALPGARTIDDAFITFRYSRNLVEGAGFVYNLGVQTLGTTTPLFALLLAGVSRLIGGQEFQWYAIALSAAADALNCALLVLIARRVIPNPLIAVLPGLLWAVSPMSVTFAVGGMETSFAVLWMLLAFWLYTAPERGSGRLIAIGVCMALGFLTRADAALWIAPLLLAQMISQWRSGGSWFDRLPLATWLAAGITMLPWLVFSLAYFGSFIPNSVGAKRAAYLVPPGSALGQFIQTYANVVFTFDAFGSLAVMISAVGYLVLVAFACLLAARSLPRLLPLLAYPFVYAAAFAALNPLIFRWYLAPPLPALLLGLVIGAWGLLRPLTQREGAVRRVPVLVVGALGAVWLFTSLSGWTLHPDHGFDRPAPRMAWHAIELEYERMALLLRDDYGVTPATRVAAADIGAVGYFSRATIVDTVGLVTPELTRYYPVDAALVAADQNYAIPPQLIADTQPDFLVTMEGFVRDGLARQAWFQSDYRLADEFPFPFYGRSMQLYQRVTPP